MSEHFVMYPGEMTSDDRTALDRPGFKLYENGVGMTDPFWQGQGAPTNFQSYQVVRVSADTPEDARRQVVEALGREPEGLRVGGN